MKYETTTEAMKIKRNMNRFIPLLPKLARAWLPPSRCVRFSVRYRDLVRRV
jgi:hypothetical protein